MSLSAAAARIKTVPLAFWVAGALFLAERGLDVSGFESLYASACLWAVAAIAALAGLYSWRNQSEHAPTPQTESLHDAEAEGVGMMKVWVKEEGLFTHDTLHLLHRLREAEIRGQYLTREEASRWTPSGPHPDVRAVIEVALEHGLVQLTFDKFAGRSFLVLTNRGRRVGHAARWDTPPEMTEAPTY
jgi:hypothetical protein